MKDIKDEVWCRREAQRIAEAREYIKHIPNSHWPTKNPRNYPGDEMMPRDYSWRRLPGDKEIHRWFFIWSYKRRNGSGLLLLRNDTAIVQSPGSDNLEEKKELTKEVLTWQGGVILGLCREVAKKEFDLLPVLADALEEYGYPDWWVIECCHKGKVHPVVKKASG